MERSFTLRGHVLYWELPSNVNKLCARCGSNQHTTKDCDNFRGRSPVPKSLARNYDRFKPEGYKPRAVPSSTPASSANSVSSSQNSSHFPSSRSPSRSPAPPKSNLRSRSSSSQQPKKTVTYANDVPVAGSSSLDASMHAPKSGGAASFNSPPKIPPEIYQNLIT